MTDWLVGTTTNDVRYAAAVSACDAAADAEDAKQLLLVLGLIELDEDGSVFPLGQQDDVLWDGSVVVRSACCGTRRRERADTPREEELSVVK